MSFFNYFKRFILFLKNLFPMMDFLLGMVPEEVSKRCYFLACGVLSYLEMGLLEG